MKMEVQTPVMGERLAPTMASASMLNMLARRRSTPAALIGEPGPSAGELDMILRIAVRVPDHRKIGPFRIQIIDASNRAAFLETLRNVGPRHIETLRGADAKTICGAFATAPASVVVISSPTFPHKTPEWEQRLVAGVVCYNTLLAASAAGFAGVWLSGWAAERPACDEIFALSPNEIVAGVIHLGTAQEWPLERERPEPARLIERWTPSGAHIAHR